MKEENDLLNDARSDLYRFRKHCGATLESVDMLNPLHQHLEARIKALTSEADRMTEDIKGLQALVRAQQAQDRLRKWIRASVPELNMAEEDKAIELLEKFYAPIRDVDES